MLETAASIWEQVKDNDQDQNTKIYDSIIEQYKNTDLVKQYPIVVSWMVHTKQYEPEVFQNIIDKYGNPATRPLKEYEHIQTSYLVDLCKHCAPNMPAEELEHFHQAMYSLICSDPAMTLKPHNT